MTRRLLAAVALGAGLLSSCGVRADPSPRALSSGDVPFGLLEQAPNTTTATTAPAAPKVPIFVYFVLGTRLQPMLRQVTEPPTVPKALSILLSGPDEQEAVTGIRSAINPAASLVPARIDPATFVVDLSAEFVQGPTSEQVLGLAQIVFTATEIQGVAGVRFTLQGAPIEVPTPSGTLTSSPVGRDAFGDLAPSPETNVAAS